MITIRYWELVLIFLAGIGFWHLAMGVIYPWYGAKMDLKIAQQKAEIAKYNAMCASAPPPIGSVRSRVDEPTVHIGQIVPVPQQPEPDEPELPIELRASRPVELLAMIAWPLMLLLPEGHRHTASHGTDASRWDPMDGPR